MNKLILALAILVATGTCFAQNADSTITPNEDESLQIISKKGYKVLPEAGDIAIGVDASPFINLVGNLFKVNNGVVFNDPSSMSFLDAGNTIYAKYFLDSKTAVRGKVRISSISTTETAYVYDDTYEGDVADYNKGEMDKQDDLKSSYSLITIGLGYEKRRGYNKLQGFYGGEFLIAFGSGSAANPNKKYGFGNEMTDDVTAPTTWNFNANTANTTNSRTTEVNASGIFGLGARGFVGVEYFIAPKISVGGELGWGLLFNKTGDTEVTTEQWDTNSGEAEKVSENIGDVSGYVLDTDNLGGQIFLLFHF